MTYEKAVKALVDAGILNKSRSAEAIAALEKDSVEFTYPDWAAELMKAGLIARADQEKASVVMQAAGHEEAQKGGSDYEDALRNAGIL
jgi:hypothetical protein